MKSPTKETIFGITEQRMGPGEATMNAIIKATCHFSLELKTNFMNRRLIVHC